MNENKWLRTLIIRPHPSDRDKNHSIKNCIRLHFGKMNHLSFWSNWHKNKKRHQTRTSSMTLITCYLEPKE